ncbi:MAG TPA: N-acetyl-gamma-glutamyl-phosphate reductase [Acidimicrobiales bacterium]
MPTAGVLGASGYAGAELVRLLAGHPELELVYATADSAAGSRLADVHPHLAAAYPDVRLDRYSLDAAAGLDVVFTALPSGITGSVVPDLLPKVGHVVDLAADFRLRDPNAYPRWYGWEHPAPALLGEAAFGLPELGRDAIRGARLVAAPGCYVTAAALALAPFVRAGAVEATGLVVDAASGVSGAGRGAKLAYAFGTVDEDFTAYGLVDHRHTPEMEQVIGGQVLFTPHLAPMTRGILATCYARPVPGGPSTTDAALALLGDAYRGEPFVVVSARVPSTKATRGANTAHLTARVDPRTGWLVVLCAIDNLVKGASGQALQCANLALGCDEALGLPLVGMAP